MTKLEALTTIDESTAKLSDLNKDITGDDVQPDTDMTKAEALDTIDIATERMNVLNEAITDEDVQPDTDMTKAEALETVDVTTVRLRGLNTDVGNDYLRRLLAMASALQDTINSAYATAAANNQPVPSWVPAMKATRQIYIDDYNRLVAIKKSDPVAFSNMSFG